MNTAFFIIKYFLFLLLITFISLSELHAQRDTTIVTTDSISLGRQNQNPADSIKKVNPALSKDAVEAVIEYECKDSMMFSMKTSQMYMYGTTIIQTEDKKIQAELINIDTEKSTFYAYARKDSTGKEIGRPVFQDGDEKFVAKDILYNFKTNKGLIHDVKTEYDEGYIHGEITKRQPNKEVHIAHGKYTTCDLDHPHFYIELTKAKVIPEEKTVSGPMYFVIADIPLYPIGLPFGYIPRPKNDASGFIVPEYGEDRTRGFFLRNGGYYWALGEHMNTAFRGEIYSYGNWGISNSTNFKKRYKYSGALNVRYNRNKTGTEGTPSYQVRDNFSVTGNYTQDAKANPYQTFSASLNFSSTFYDSDNAVNINQYSNNTKQSSISYRRSRPGGRFNLSAGINATQNTSTKTTNLSLPVIALNMNRWQPAKNISGKKKLFIKNFSIGYSSNFKNTLNIADSLLFTQEALYEMRNGFQYSVPVGTSFKLAKYINVSPSFKYNGRIYGEYVTKRPAYVTDASGELEETVAVDTLQGFRHPFDFSFSIPFSTKIFGIYKGKGKHKSALRHVVTPSISYNYRPDFSAEKWGYYDYYQEDKDPASLYSYYDTGIFGAPPKGKSGSIGFNLGNNFELKTKTKKDTSAESFTKIKILENFTVGASYNLAADSMNLSMISLRGNTRLFNNFSMSYSSSYDPYARDTLGARINAYEWDVNHKLARLSNTRISLNGTIKSKDKSKENNSGAVASALTEKNAPAGTSPIVPSAFYDYPDIAYADFNVPWSLTFSYTLNIINKYNTSIQDYELTPTQTLNLNGNFSLTSNWRITARADYDFKLEEISNLNFTINRDLHCWEMSFAATPIGRKMYVFRINIKSSMFEGLEYKKEKSIYENF